MPFSSLGLSAELLRAVSDKGYPGPTPIQRQAIPVILAGRDILAGAQTGTGKTAGFTLPLLQRLGAAPPGSGGQAIRALILTPTRELAAQVQASVRTYGKYLPLKSGVIFGGVGFTPQVDMLRRGVDVLVATPGRLLDHVGQKTIDLSKVEILVLDEADRMLDMGFIRDIRRILALLPRRRQNLLFSATYSDAVRELADGLLHQPALIEVARRNTAAELVRQVVHPVDRERKRELLSHLVRANDWRQVLVFMRTKHGANRLAEQLGKDGIHAAAIHGNKSQGARTKALADFKNGSVRVLVATDIAARGLDIDQLPHVVNFELPNVPEDYVHRIGRTGRAGREGEALSLVCVDERDYLRDIERLLSREIPKVLVAGFEPDPSIQAEPIRQGRGQRGDRPARAASCGDGRPQAPRHGDGRSRGNAPRRDAEQRRSGPTRRGGDHPSGPRPHGRFASGYRGNHATHRPEADGNRRVGIEVDGNRWMPQAPASHARVRSAHGKSRQPSGRSRPRPAKGNIRRSW